MAYDYSKLSGKIVEICKTRAKFAEKMGLSEKTVSMKLNNLVFWKQPEITKAAEILGIEPDSIQDYFFKIKVQTY